MNRAIAECHANGVVTSATLMANSRAFQDAVMQAQAMPNLGVGCHVMLVDGEPLTDAPGIARQGRFRQGIAEFGLRALGGRYPAKSLEAETAAQFAKLRNAGL